ncbi:MAG: PaaI family thioesterase [Pseudomonadota bacterium]
MSETWDAARIDAFLDEAFAPWVKLLGLRTGEIRSDGAQFTLPENTDLARGGGEGGGVISGQAVAAAADTCSVLTLIAVNQAFRPCTTVDLTTHFMRPLPVGDVDIAVHALSNGRRMATLRAEFRGGNGKLAAVATLAFAYLDT